MLILPTPTMRLSTAAKKQDIVTVTNQTNLGQGEAVVKEEVVTLTATIETNLRHGDLETEVATETDSIEDVVGVGGRVE